LGNVKTQRRLAETAMPCDFFKDSQHAERGQLRRLNSMAQIEQLCAVSGEFDYVAWLRSDSPEQLGDTRCEPNM
jgi:hypothetical protein